MLKDITLGQFFPGNTIVHRLDPRTKILLTVLYIAVIFVANTFGGYVLCAGWLAMIMALSRIRPRAVLKGLKPLIFIIVFTAVLNIFFSSGEDVLFQWRFITVTGSGILHAVAMVVRMILLVSGTFLLTYTTSPMAITDGLEKLLSPLKRLRVPVYELTLMMSIALRFIPALIEETDRIMSAQKARGADLETGTLPERAKALLPILIPLFISAFRRAEELANAMECRCYNGGSGRTAMKTLKLHTRDALAAVAGLALLGCVILFRSFSL